MRLSGFSWFDKKKKTSLVDGKINNSNIYNKYDINQNENKKVGEFIKKIINFKALDDENYLVLFENNLTFWKNNIIESKIEMNDKIKNIEILQNKIYLIFDNFISKLIINSQYL